MLILMTVRDASAMIHVRVTPVLMERNVLLTFIAIHRQARQSSEEFVDQVSYHNLTSIVSYICWKVLRLCHCQLF